MQPRQQAAKGRVAMGKTLVRARGTLTASGTIVLDRRVPIQAGEVEVTVQGLAELAPTEAAQPNDIISVLARIGEQRRAMGYVPRSAEEVDAYINEMRDEDDEYLQKLGRMQDEAARIGMACPAPSPRVGGATHDRPCARRRD